MKVYEKERETDIETEKNAEKRETERTKLSNLEVMINMEKDKKGANIVLLAPPVGRLPIWL